MPRRISPSSYDGWVGMGVLRLFEDSVVVAELRPKGSNDWVHISFFFVSGSVVSVICLFWPCLFWSFVQSVIFGLGVLLCL